MEKSTEAILEPLQLAIQTDTLSLALPALLTSSPKLISSSLVFILHLLQRTDMLKNNALTLTGMEPTGMNANGLQRVITGIVQIVNANANGPPTIL